MKKLAFILISIFILSSNSIAKDGSGELKFTSQSYENFLAYLRGDGDPKATGVMMTSGLPLGFAINQKVHKIGRRVSFLRSAGMN